MFGLVNSNTENGNRSTLQIRKDVHQRFAKTCKDRAVGRSMNDAATRIIDWFCRQKPLAQTAVTSDVDQGMEHAYAEALKRLAEELEQRRETHGVIRKGDQVIHK